MKIYKLSTNNADIGAMLSWHSSKRAARRALKVHMDESDGYGGGMIFECDIPVDREGLLAWLNVYFTTDNG